MKILFCVLMISMLFIAISGCAAGPNELENIPDDEGKVAGFWQGLWQGFISPFTFLVSLFSDTVNIYEVHNNGGWYNFGFMFGVTLILSGSGGGAAASRRRRST